MNRYIFLLSQWELILLTLFFLTVLVAVIMMIVSRKRFRESSVQTEAVNMRREGELYNYNRAEYGYLKKRYIGIDLFKIFCAIVVCMFHTTIHLNCYYGIFQCLSNIGSVFMTAFFLLSGFSIFTNWSSKNLSEPLNTKLFWKKRLVSIMPMYIIAATLYVLIDLVTGKESIFRELVLLPIKAFGLQSVFPSFNFSHTGGTWFISCILICYLVYPLLQGVIINSSKRSHIILFIFCTFFLLYSPFVVSYMSIPNIYSNPFFRVLEFFAGMIIAALKVDYSPRMISNGISVWIVVIVVSLIAFLGITYAGSRGISRGNYVYSWICLPYFEIMIYLLSYITSSKLEHSKLIKYFAQLTYVFYLAQLFSNSFCKEIIKQYAIEDNLVKILLGWGICMIITVVFEYVKTSTSRLFSTKILPSGN